MTRRRRRKNTTKRPSTARNIRARVKRFFGWPWIKKRRLQTVGRLVFKLGLWGAVALGMIVVYLSISLPNIKDAVDTDNRPTIVLLDRTGVEFARLGDTKGDMLTVGEISPHMIKAVLAIEDRRFYSHYGIDPIGLGRALINNITGQRNLQGGSTITQQLAKNLFLSPERTLTRKAKEALLALYLERRYSKNDILAAYLNRVYFGAGAYGVDSAARVYFGTTARKLNLEQAALLAGLLKAPSRFSPDNDPKLAVQRTRIVLQAMVAAGYLRPGAEKMPLQPLPKRDYSATGNLNMRYFADWIMPQVESYIGTPTQNLIINTTLDAALQLQAMKAVETTMADRGPKAKAGEAAIITMTPDGAVLAMVGGRDYTTSEYNRATLARRQPGSAFKPFVFIAAMEKGYAPDTVAIDEPFSIGKYRPQNYDGRYYGPVTLKDALARSLNTVAVRLLQDVGVNHVVGVAQRLGIADPLTHDLSLALGASGVRLISLTAAYATLANRGLATEAFGIRDIRSAQGNLLYQRRAIKAPAVLSADTVSKINTMMQGVILYGTGQAAMLDRPAAGKTGTSSNYRDALFVGYTADIVTGVWVGNDDNSPMNKVTGGNIPAQIWRDVMMAANKPYAIKPLPTVSITQPMATHTAPGSDTMDTTADPNATVFGRLLQQLIGEPPPAPQPEAAPTIHWDQ